MKHLIRKGFCTLFILSSFVAVAQKEKFSVKFKNGKFISGEKLNAQRFNKKNIEKALYNDQYFVLLQFASIPSQKDQQDLLSNGIILHQYISDNAYLAIMKKNFANNFFTKFKIITVSHVPAMYKIDKSIFDFTDSRDKKTQILFSVKYFRSFNQQLAEQALRNAGAMIVYSKYSKAGNLYIQPDTSVVNKIAALPFVTYISVQSITDKLLNYTQVAASAVSGLYDVNGKNLHGKGITLGVGDNSYIATHVDFSGRVIDRTSTTPQLHGTHTSGTAAGGGILDIKYHGIAPKATIINQYFSDIIVNAPTYFQDNQMVVTNNSYYSGLDGCPGEGGYDDFSNYADEQIYNYNQLIHVVAAGNDGNLTCSPFPAAFGTVKTGWQCAKNVLTVGAIQQQNYAGTYFSSCGPVADGRLKPEISAGGWNVYSTTPYNTYGYGTGTSMAAPAVTGVLTLMNERYRKINGGKIPASALMKAIVCNTADDLGNPGPDFTYGFGMINARKAINAIDSSKYFLDSISASQNKQYTIHVPVGAANVKILLYWADVAAAANAAQTLVNDLDLTVTDASATLHHPLILNPAPNSVNNIAIEGADHLNNIEQVVINNPPAGDYTINVNGFAVPFGVQNYVVTYQILSPSLVVEYPFGGETWVPGDAETIRWNYTGNSTTPFKLEYSLNNGNSWYLIKDSIPVSTTSLNYYNWTVPAVVTDSALIRVTQNATAISDISNYNFTILTRPNIAVTPLCVGSVQLNWTKISGATSYDVLMLDTDSMKVIATLSDTMYKLTGLNKFNTYWFSVRPKINNIFGRSAVSVSVIPNSGSCSDSLFRNDIKVDSILTPNTARKYFHNDSISKAPVSVLIRNLGSTTIVPPFTVTYLCEGGTATETCNQSVAPGGTLNYIFSTPIIFDTTGFHYHFKSWATYSLDNIHNDDTAYKTVSLLQNIPISSLPVTEGFENDSSETYNYTQGIFGNDDIDFMGSSMRARARTFVNTGFARTGIKAMTLDQSPYNDTLNTDSLILTYNLQLYANKQLRFNFYYKNQGQIAGNTNKLYIRGSEFDNWIPAYDLYQNQAGLGEYALGLINVNAVLNSAQPPQSVTNTFQAKFRVEGNTSANSPFPITYIDNGYTLDDISMQEAPNDIAVVKMISPNNISCGLSANNPITVNLESFSATTQKNISINYQINNGAIISEMIDSISPLQNFNYTFNQTADLSAFIDYAVKVWIADSADNYHSNDTINLAVHGSPLITSYPYLERFENSDGNFYTNGTNSSWQWGTPNKPVITKAANGTKVWTTNLTGDYNNSETSYLNTPCFDLSGLVQPVLSFAHIYQIETTYDFTWVEYTTDGVTWQKLGTSGAGTNWYDNAAANNWLLSDTIWHVASIDIPVTNTVIRFRFVMSSDEAVTYAGVGIDDVHIFDKAPVYADSVSVSASSNVSDTDWVHFLNGNNRIASINSNGQNLGNTTVTVYPNNSYIKNNNGKYYLGRSIVIKPTNIPTSNVAVRLYFTDLEAKNLLTAPVCTTCSLPLDAFELGVTKFSGITENGSLDDNVSGNYQLIIPDSTNIVPYDNGYYAEINVNSFSEFWLSKSDTVPTTPSNCTGNPVVFTSVIGQQNYQWQANTGSGFFNITNGINYTGVTTDSLTIINIPDSMSGTQYRCLINGVADNYRVLRLTNTWNGSMDTNWFNAANWDCGTVPDQNTDVIIKPVANNIYPVIPADAAVKSIQLQSNTSVNVNGGIHFQIKGTE